MESRVRKQRYVKVLASQALQALRALGECKVEAAGSMYVTFWFEDFEADCERLSKENIFWSFDK